MIIARQLALVALLVAGQVLGSISALAQQAHQIPELAAYSQHVNQIAFQYNELSNRAVEYDALAYGVVDGTLSPEDAESMAQSLSIELWSEYKRVNEHLDSLPAIPNPAMQGDLRVRLEATRAMASSAREMAKTLILSGEKLVEAAVMGDEDVFSRLEIRNTEVMLAQLGHQVTLIDLHLSSEDRRYFNYYLNSAIKAEFEALVLLLKAAVVILKSDSMDGLDRTKQEVRVWLDKGYGHIDTGKRIAQRTLRFLKSSTPKTSAEARLYPAMIEIMEGNVPQAFDVESQILGEIGSLNRKGFVLGQDEIDDFFVRFTRLEEARQNLLLERQRRLATLQ